MPGVAEPTLVEGGVAVFVGELGADFAGGIVEAQLLQARAVQLARAPAAQGVVGGQAAGVAEMRRAVVGIEEG